MWAHISGSDLVRDDDGQMYVLEDNLRVPSGVSYVIENRGVAKRAFAELFARQRIRPVDGYTDALNSPARPRWRPTGCDDPQLAVLTPGIFNSAYFEHSFLAERMGAELVEGADLVVGDDDCVYMKTIRGHERSTSSTAGSTTCSSTRRCFREDSMLGVPGLMRAWRAGNVALANAPGAGVADDKVVYAWVPDMIRYYLDEEPIDPERAHLPNDVRRGAHVRHRQHRRPRREAGQRERRLRDRDRQPCDQATSSIEAVAAIEADPRNWVAQPILALSTVPTLVEEGIEPRHVDLRPFILTGEVSYVTPGGLTRVALPKGSLVVNSSQGGGSKDTWIVDGRLPVAVPDVRTARSAG